MRLGRPRLTYANVMSTLAAVAALTSTAYASGTISGSSIIDRSITGGKVASETLHGRTISGLTGADIAASSLTTGDLNAAANAVYKAGSAPEVVTANSADTDSTDVKSAQATCPAGKVVVGGGYVRYGTFVTPVDVQTSQPQPDLSAWYVIAAETTNTADTWYVAAYAICVKST